MIMNKEKTPTSVRLSPVAKEILQLERGDLSETAYLESLVLSNAKTEKAKALLRHHLKNNPMVKACFDGAGIKMDFNFGLAC
jgi:hypothetical protein